jgi:hypothetical protein
MTAREGTTGAVACRWGLDRPPAAVWAPISRGKVAIEGHRVGQGWRANDARVPPLTHDTKRCLDPTDRSRCPTRSRRPRGCAAPVNMCRAGGEDAYGRAMPYIRLSAATHPPATAATKSAIAPPCATPALARLVAQGAVSVASTRWASEERRKGEGRTGAGTGACIRSVPSACTHQQALSTSHAAGCYGLQEPGLVLELE